MAVNQVFDCAQCKTPSGDLFFDKRYKQSICRSCFLDRRRGAAVALDTEWLVWNIPFEQFTENEKERAGIASLEEYERVRNPRDEENPYDHESTRDLRAKKVPYKEF